MCIQCMPHGDKTQAQSSRIHWWYIAKNETIQFCVYKCQYHYKWPLASVITQHTKDMHWT